MSACPVCAAVVTTRRAATPYWMCSACDAWFQDPMPLKTYEAEHEKAPDGGFAGHLMSEHDKRVNDDLAEWMFVNFLDRVPSKVLRCALRVVYTLFVGF